jgi:hypothetical protein
VSPALACALAILGAGRTPAQEHTPAPITIVHNGGPTADGYIFYTQQSGPSKLVNNGPVIMDNQGRPVWFLPLTSEVAGDFRVQTYRGQPVLTWAQGRSFQDAVPGTGKGYILDPAYRVVATIQAGNGMNEDLHEFQLTPEGTALITIYHVVAMDLTSYGGVSDGLVLEGAVQEIDVASGNVLFEWHSLDHVTLDESNFAVPATRTMHDYFHINAVTRDLDGNLLISARHTSTIYKVNRATGEIMWRLGGKRNNFALGDGVSFGWQHNVVAVDAGTIRLFDNDSNGRPSQVLWIRHDDRAMTATLVRSIQHPTGIASYAEGSAQALPNGNTIVGWGSSGGMSEFDANGTVVFDGRQPAGQDNYRTYRFAWKASPATKPLATAVSRGDGSMTVHAIWNGATEVASWRVLGGVGDGPVAEVTTVPWNGLDTAVAMAAPLDAVQVVALDSTGSVIGMSDIATGPFAGEPPAIVTQPIGRTVAFGSTVVLGVTTSGPATYQWACNGAPLSDGTTNSTVISGATTPTLMIRGARYMNGGLYVCTVSNPGGSTRSTPATLTVVSTGNPGRLINLSCRSEVGTGDKALIVGFVVGGNGAASKQLLVRASGPALDAFGIADTLADPQLDLFKIGAAGLSPLASDADWNGNTAVNVASKKVNAFPWTDPHSRDAALVNSLPAGGYTAMVTSADASNGIALAETYDADAPAAPATSGARLVNVSGRAQVGTGDNILVAGFVIGGTTARTVLVRASGPGLVPFGVSGVLQQPKLQLYDSTDTLLASNAGWGGEAQIASAAGAVGAFPWVDPDGRDSALLMTLPPGEYTAHVSGDDGGTGVALVEVYEVP